MAEPYETPPSMQDIYDKDKERYSESDRLIEEGDLKGAAEVHPDKGELRNNLTNQIAGTTLEIGTGYAVDSVTAPLLALGPWGWLGYGISNFSSGVASNYAAQKLRGVEEIGWGELLQSGLIDLIPYFGTQAKGVKSVANVALQSGARTIAGEQLRVGIDEGRVLTPSEVAVSGTLGTVIGGSLKSAGDIFSRKAVPSEVPIESDALFDMQRQMAGLKPRLLKSIDPDQDPIPLSQRSSSLAPSQTRDWSRYERDEAAYFQETRWPRDTEFNELGNLIKSELTELYPDIPISYWRKHHTNPLKQGAQLLNGVKPEFRVKGIQILLREGIYAGHNPAQMSMIPKVIHTKIHRFINQRVGKKYSVKYLESRLPEGTKLKDVPWPERERLVKEYAAAIKESQMKIYDMMTALAVNKKYGPQVLPEVLAKLNSKVDADDVGLDALLKEIKVELGFQAITGTTPKIDVLKLAQQWQEVDPIKFEALMFKVQGATTKQVKSRFPGLSAKQLSIFEQITPQQYQMLQNRYGLSGKQGIFSKPVDPP